MRITCLGPIWGKNKDVGSKIWGIVAYVDSNTDIQEEVTSQIFNC